MLQIKAIMKQKGITQSELAERLGVDRVSVNRLVSERNADTIRKSSLVRIAKALDCEVSDLYTPFEPTFVAMVSTGTDAYRVNSIEELEKLIAKLKQELPSD